MPVFTDRRPVTLARSLPLRILAVSFSVGALLFLIFNHSLFDYGSDGFYLSYYIGSLVLAILIGPLLLLRLHLSERTTCWLSLGIFLGSAFPLFMMMEAFDLNGIFSVFISAFFFNLLMIWLICWILYSFCSSFVISLRIAAVLFYLLGLINSAVRTFRGTPISALDLYNIRTAAAVAGGYRYPFEFYFFTATLLFLFVWVLAGKATWRCRSRRARWISRGSCAVCVAGFCVVFSNTAFLNQIGIEDYLWNQNLAFEDNGLLVSVAYSTKYLQVEVPEDYSPEQVQQIADKVQENTSPLAEEQPNLIVIMNESLYDLATAGSFETDLEYMPFLHSMQGRENTITGQLRVSTFGGGTCNTEFEFLTGCSLGFFPSGSVVYQQYIRQEIPSLVTLLREQGYTANAVHPFYNYCWNRNKVYPLLGFEHFYDLSDFPGAKMLGSYVSNCVSDESDYEKLIELFEEKEPGQPLFLFNVTMQNHGGYAKLLNTPDELVHMNKGSYTSSYADNYLSLIRASDAAFEDLISYFEQVEEPTIILLFGDHAPNLPDGVYEQLMGKDLDDLTLEETQQRYTTPFVLWANYDIETGDGDAGTVSANYLSTLLLRTAGLKTSTYMDFLDQLSQQVPAINLNGYIGADGVEYSFDEESEYLDLIEEYRSLQYNYLFDNKNRLDSLFTLQ